MAPRAPREAATDGPDRAAAAGERATAPTKASKPARPWQRAEAGRYRSADERFTLESDGAGRWYVTDESERDELGLPRTTGPHATLDAAKAAADEARERPAATSPLAARLAEAAARPQRRAAKAPTSTTAEKPAPLQTPTVTPKPASGTRANPRAAPVPRTWLDDLADADRDAAVRARRLIDALAAEGIGDAEALVRRDILGDTPAVATRLIARDVLAAIARLRDPSAAAIAEAVAGILAGSPKRRNLPGWTVVERDGPGGRTRSIRLTGDDLEQAARDASR